MRQFRKVYDRAGYNYATYFFDGKDRIIPVSPGRRDARWCAPCLRESRRRTIRAITEYRIAMKYLFCVLLALSLAACGKETEDPGLSREEFLDLFPLHEHGEVYVEPFYVRFYYPGGNCLLFPTDILGESPAAPVQYMFLHLDGSDVPPRN